MTATGRKAASLVLAACIPLSSCREIKGFPLMSPEAFPEAYNLTANKRGLPDSYKLNRQYCDRGSPIRCVYVMRTAQVVVLGLRAGTALERVTVECSTACEALDAFAAAITVLRTLAPDLSDADYAGWIEGAKEDLTARRPLRVFVGTVLMWIYPPGSISDTNNLTFELSAAADR